MTYSEISRNDIDGAFSGFRTTHPEHGRLVRRWRRPVARWMRETVGSTATITAAFTCEYACGARTTFVRHEPAA